MDRVDDSGLGADEDQTPRVRIAEDRLHRSRRGPNGTMSPITDVIDVPIGHAHSPVNSDDDDDDDTMDYDDSEEGSEDSESSESEGEECNDHGMALRSTRVANGCMEKAEFKDLVKEILGEEKREDGGKFGIRLDALDVLQKASEDMLAELFGKANEVAKMGKREKIKVTDIQAVRLCEEIAKQSGSERNPPRIE
ncbi:hypothetical protein CRE_19895 [Caenorhabditis remanei]|uniref:Core Histone H2A/H2B/H3 domain-containing protein n=1 Tax=Caenorhabditis remanei TaxID=31234 RepID=E3N306_CAERE|nr:hypothetical protein CRE_19895 [Caenorhabditis remanei]